VNEKDSVLLAHHAQEIFRTSGSDKLFVFLNEAREMDIWRQTAKKVEGLVLILPGKLQEAEALPLTDIPVLRVWSGNQSRFSRVKYAILKGCSSGIITTRSKITCLLGASGKSRLDTVIVHDLESSWSDDFPFDPGPLTERSDLSVIMAVLDIALDIGALGREGKSIGTIFMIGDAQRVLDLSHQAVFNPFEGYKKEDCSVGKAEVVESLKELAKIDGAFVIDSAGIVRAAGRHLQASGQMTIEQKGFGSRHRSAASLSNLSSAVAIVVSESTGRVTIFCGGKLLSTLEPVISRRLE
jgi:hypothetical protein